MKALSSFIAILLSAAASQAAPAESSGFLRDGSYLTKSGIIFDSTCFLFIKDQSQDADQKLLEAVKLEDTSDAMLKRVAECSEKRHFKPLASRFYGKLRSHPRFTCKPATCPDSNKGSEGCAFQERNEVNLNNKTSAELSAAVWFHELLHLTGLDNQRVEIHNLHTDEIDARDAIVFWERTCFRPNEILAAASKYQTSPCRMSIMNWSNGAPRSWLDYKKMAASICSKYDAWLPKFKSEYESSLLPIELDYERIERPVQIMNSIYRSKKDFDLTLPKHANLPMWRLIHCTAPEDRHDLKACLIRYRDKMLSFIKKHENDIDFCLNRSELEGTRKYLESIAEKTEY